MLNGRLFDDADGNITCISNDGRSLVDYIIASTSLFDKVSYFCVDDHDFSDHFPVTCTLKLQHVFNVGILSATDNDAGTRSWSKYKWKEPLKRDFLDRFRYYYADFKNKLHFYQNNITQHLQSFVKVFQQAGDSMKIKLPTHKPNKEGTQPEWWDQSCSPQKSKKFHALKKFRSTNLEEDFLHYKNERNHFKSICKIKQKEFQKKRRAMLIEAKNSPKEFWKIIKMSHRVSANKNEISNNDWINYFQTLFSSPDTHPEINHNHPLHNIVQNNNTDCLGLPITEIEIRQAISKLKSDCSGGPDGLCIELFKSVTDDIGQFLFLPFSDIYNTGVFPEDWCKSIISPIHKSGPINNPENHRAIVLINCLCKIFMTILTSRLTDWAETHNVIDESQAGFRKGYSTIDNSFHFKQLCINIFVGRGADFIAFSLILNVHLTVFSMLVCDIL